MAGKRLLDIAALFNASRGVVKKHVAFRSRQIDAYNRTSTLARAVRNQTDRVTETVKAASFLVSRLNEEQPSWPVENVEVKSDGHPIPNKETSRGLQAHVKIKEGQTKTIFTKIRGLDLLQILFLIITKKYTRRRLFAIRFQMARLPLQISNRTP
jgi:hypothetical protein